MPKKTITPFTYYSFRYDYEDDVTRDKILAFIKRECPKYAIFDEISSVVEKKHIQGKIGKCISSEQLRKHFKEAFPNLFSKSNYSIKDIKEPENYDSYICKDGVPLLNNVFEDDYIALQKIKHNEIQKKVIAADAKKKTTTFTYDVAKEFVDKYPDQAFQIINEHYEYRCDKSVTESAKKTLLHFLLKRLGKVAKVFDDNVLQRMYNGIKNYIIMTSGRDDVEYNYISTFENRITL